MTKSEYAKLLLTEQWNQVRLRILRREGLKCRKCGATNCRLNVHHKIYLKDKLPWEVPDKYLETLCDVCHSKAHENRLISSFIHKDIPKEKKPIKQKLKTLSQEDKVFIAKLCVLCRIQPTNRQWLSYKKKLFEYKSLSKDEKAIINKSFVQAKNKIMK